MRIISKTNLTFFISSLLASVPASANLNIQPKIIGGSNAQTNEAPWQVYVENQNNGFAKCGGTVIADTWILTAAHCLDTADNTSPFSLVPTNKVIIYSGKTNILDGNIDITEVKSLHIHPGYDKVITAKDIALIELKSPIPAPAKAIKMMDDAAQIRADIEFNSGLENNLYLSGWGRTVADKSLPDSGTNDLQKVLLSGVADDTCSDDWGLTTASFNADYVCANGVGTGSCKGDSGGPLVWQDKNHRSDNDNGYRLVGVVSFGHNSRCANDAYPDVYTQVSSFRAWINSVITNYQEPEPTFNFDIYNGVSLDKNNPAVTTPDSNDTAVVSTPDSNETTNATAPEGTKSTSKGSGGGSAGIFTILGLTGLMMLRRKKREVR